MTARQRRKKRARRLEIPARLRDLASAATAHLDLESIERRLNAAGVRELSLNDENQDQPSRIRYRTASHEGWVDVLYEEWDAPIGTALAELAGGLPDFDLLVRLHIMMTDMELVADAARDLAAARDDTSVQHPLRLVDGVLEVGIVTMYARSFTGEYAVGDRWRPEGGADRELHKKLIVARNEVYAHAVRTPSRTLVNTTALLGGDGPPIYAEQRDQLGAARLRAIEAMCRRQYKRLWAATAELKKKLGSPVAERPDPGGVP